MPIETPSNAWGIKDSNKSGLAVGKDVTAWCGRCKLNRIHTIVTVDATRRADRVQCRSCHSEHKFRVKDVDNSNLHSGGHGMFEADDEHDAPAEPPEGFLPGEETPKKPKAKPKKKKSDSETSHSGKNSGSLPLSMMKPSSEDLAQYQSKLSALKANPGVAVRDYSVSAARFNPGEVMRHKTFGVGFVVAESGRDKVEVLFDQGRKLLVTAPKPT